MKRIFISNILPWEPLGTFLGHLSAEKLAHCAVLPPTPPTHASMGIRPRRSPTPLPRTPETPTWAPLQSMLYRWYIHQYFVYPELAVIFPQMQGEAVLPEHSGVVSLKHELPEHGVLLTPTTAP